MQSKCSPDFFWPYKHWEGPTRKSGPENPEFHDEWRDKDDDMLEALTTVITKCAPCCLSENRRGIFNKISVSSVDTDVYLDLLGTVIR